MNKNYILIYLLCVCSLSFVQKKSLKWANQLFANKAYVEAAEIYEQLNDSDTTKYHLQKVDLSFEDPLILTEEVA